jgi:Zn-dependent protease
MLIDIIQNAIRGQQMDLGEVVSQILATLFVIFCILPIHEWAHARAAASLGDNTAKLQGRMSLNPLVSFDPVGAMFLLLFGFGWAKPVPIDSRYFKNPKRDTALTALAGPVSNLIAGLAGALILFGIIAGAGGMPNMLYYFLLAYIQINVALAVFNLIPLPPLDGSKILGAFLSDRALYNYYRYQNIIITIAFFVLLFGILDIPLMALQTFFSQIILWLGKLPYVLLGLLR